MIMIMPIIITLIIMKILLIVYNNSNKVNITIIGLYYCYFHIMIII